MTIENLKTLNEFEFCISKIGYKLIKFASYGDIFRILDNKGRPTGCRIYWSTDGIGFLFKKGTVQTYCHLEGCRITADEESVCLWNKNHGQLYRRVEFKKKK